MQIPESLQTLLASGAWDATPRGFRIITLSFIADGCVAEARADPRCKELALRHIDAALTLATASKPKGVTFDRADHGLWLAHFALILGARQALAERHDLEDTHRSIAEALAKRSLAEPTAHVPSFAGKPERFPADQAAVLAALARYDGVHRTQLAREPAERFDAFLVQHSDADTGLPWSQVAPTTAKGKLPRGCALSWQTRYLAEVLPKRARDDWAAYREHYFFDAGLLVGFREWPPGRDRPADVDSGPIVRGVGTAASALAIAAARRMGDETLALRLEASAATVMALLGSDPKVAAQANTKLAQAIRYLGRVERKD